MGTRAVTAGEKWPGRETDHSPPSSTEVKNACSYTSISQNIFMAWWLVKQKNNFMFYFTFNEFLEGT
jgi:hypothetical protein